MIDVRIFGTKLEDLVCEECEVQANHLARYKHPEYSYTFIGCRGCARRVFADELALREDNNCPHCGDEMTYSSQILDYECVPCDVDDNDRACDAMRDEAAGR